MSSKNSKTKDEPIKEFKSGAKRSVTTDKGRYDLLPPDAIHLLAQVYEWGCKQKGDRNWEKGIPLSRFLDSALRHTFQALNGKTDEPHAAQATWNLLGYIQTKMWIEQGILPPELDDLPKRGWG